MISVSGKQCVLKVLVSSNDKIRTISRQSYKNTLIDFRNTSLTQDPKRRIERTVIMKRHHEVSLHDCNKYKCSILCEKRT